MQRKVFIFLHPFLNKEVEASVDWLIFDRPSATPETILGATLNQLRLLDNDEIIVLVPTQEVVLTQAALPKLSSYRLQQTLPYALEEELLDEVEELHFAPGPYQENQALPVAVLKKEALEQWLALLEQADIQADALVPHSLALPYTEREWSLWIQGEYAEVRTGPYAGFSTDLSNLETLLSLKLSEGGIRPEQLMIYSALHSSHSLKNLNLPIQQKELAPEELLSAFAASINQGSFINLLQPPYSPAHKLRIHEKNKKAWKIAGFALTLWLSLLILTPLLSVILLTFEHWQLEHRINRIYYHYFPQATALVEPEKRLEAEYRKVSLSKEKTLFLQWLSAVAKVAASVRIENLNFQNNQLILDLSAASFVNLDAFTNALKAEAFEVKQQSAALADNQVKAVLIIGRKTA